MYEIIAVKDNIFSTSNLDWVENELYVKLRDGVYQILRSRFSKFNKKRLTRKIVDDIVNARFSLCYPNLPNEIEVVYRYEI